MTSAPRIVSLVPSITELIVDLGWASYLVGRTGFCIHPKEVVRQIAKVGGTKDVNIDKIRRLAPSHVIVNVDENELPTVQALREFVPRVIVTHPRAPQDNLVLIDQLLAEFAPYLIASGAQYMPAITLKSQINQGLRVLAGQQFDRQNVLYLIWRKPWMTVARDTYISRMLALIGWQTWPQVQGELAGASRYPVLTGQEPWLAQIDRVLLSSEPYRFRREHVSRLRSELPKLNVQAKLQLVDGELLSWYGSRSIKGLAYLAELAGAAPSEGSASDSA